MKTCKTCKHWDVVDNDPSGVCKYISSDNATLAHVATVTFSPTGLNRDHETTRQFVTYPDFGCVLHEPNQNRLTPNDDTANNTRSV